MSSLRPALPTPLLLQLIIAGLQSGQWGRKKAAAAAVARVCQAAGDVLAPHAAALLDALLKVRRPVACPADGTVSPRPVLPPPCWPAWHPAWQRPAVTLPHSARCLALLPAPHLTPPHPRPRAELVVSFPCEPLQETPGRIWDGKEAVLAALGSLAAACPASLNPEQRRRLVAALLDAASKKKSAYRKEALVQLEAALLAFGGGSDSSGSGGEEGDFWAAASPLLLEQAGSFVEAAQGGAAMEVDQAQGGSGGTARGGDNEPHPGKAVPAAQVAACLGAAFATAAPATARQHADGAAAALAALLGAAGKAADQLAAVAAGRRLAEHAARVAAGPGARAHAAQQQQDGQGLAPEAGLAPTPGQPGFAALLQAALRLAEEGKVSQLREACLHLRCVGPADAPRHEGVQQGMPSPWPSSGWMLCCPGLAPGLPSLPPPCPLPAVSSSWSRHGPR